jgi:cytochrome P450
MDTSKVLPGPQWSEEEIRTRFLEDSLGLLEWCQSTYGEIFVLKLGMLNKVHDVACNGDWVFLTRPDHMRVMYRAQGHVLNAGEANSILFGVASSSTGSIRLDGFAHRSRRKLLQPIFNGERLKSYVDLIRTYVRRRLETWRPDAELVILREMQEITIRIIIATVFGIGPSTLQDDVCDALLKVENAEFSMEEASRFEQHLSDLIHKEIQTRRETNDPGGEDVFSIMMKSRDSEGQLLPENEIHDEMISLLKAGFGTTANTLAWVFDSLIRYPEVANRVRTELRPLYGKDKRSEAFAKPFDYTEAVIKETLRLRPLSGINGVRLLKESIEIGPYAIPKGSILVNCSYLLHRDTEIYPDHQNFRPERFLEEKIDAYSWTPFGGGTRMCVGRSFAMQEMKIVLAEVLNRFNLEPVNLKEGTQRQRFFLAPLEGLRIRISPRS